MSQCLAILIGPRHVTVAVAARRGGAWAAAQPVSREIPGEGASPRLLAGLAGDLRRSLNLKGRPTVAVAVCARHFAWRHLACQVNRRHRSAALASAFEEESPLPMERLHLVFRHDGNSPGASGNAFVLAAERAWLSELLEELERFGLGPEVLVPDTLLMAALARKAEAADESAPARRLACVESDGRPLVLLLEDERLAGWQEYADRPAAERDLPRWSLAEGLIAPQEILWHEPGEVDLLGELARLAMEAPPPENLCVGPFRCRRRMLRWRRHGLAAAVATTLAALVGAGSLFIGAGRAEQAAADLRVAQAEAWQRLAPGQPPPASLLVRLESDAARLKALTGESGSLPAYRSARLTLQEVFAALPNGVRLDVAELRVDQREVTIRGETGSHADAERIARALDSLPGLECPLPRSDVLGPGRVTFVIHAALVEGEERHGQGR